MSERSAVCVIEQALLKSKAYRSLSSPTAYFVLGIFWTKRQIGMVGRSGKKQTVILNNCEIVFAYTEAKKKYGISYSAFRAAIDELRQKGFIDIAESGAGLYKSANLYALNDRWRFYGTPEYVPPKPRPKKPINKGFQRENQYGRNCKKKNPTVEVQHGATVTEQHSIDEKSENLV